MGKRSYGTGHLYESRGAWYGRWRDPSGAQFNRKVGPKRTAGAADGLTKGQAERKLRELIQAEELVTATARVDVAEAGALLLRRLEARGAKKSYVETVESILRVHLAPYFKTKDLGRLDEDDVERYVALKRRAGMAAKTIRNHLGVLHSVFALGQRRRWCTQNPVTLAEGPRVRRNTTRIRFLNEEELEALLRVAPADDPFGALDPILYLTAAMTGLRQNECLALRWRDVDWAAQRIRVVRGYVRSEFNDPKSETSSRSVPAHPRVLGALEGLSRRSKFIADDDLVFAHPATGRPLDRSKLLKRLKAALRRAKVREVTFHELRHTFGTRCAAAGVPIRTIQAWMGHEDAATTEIYAHYAPSAHEVELVERAFTHGLVPSEGRSRA